MCFGDEGKGTTVDALTRRYESKLTIRFNGGCQAAHNVITPEGRHHTFRQFGSGTFAGASTFLSNFMLVNPVSLSMEAEKMADAGVRSPLQRLFIDGRALIITPYHAALNRLREISRGKARHGSCGEGIGETVNYAIQNPVEALRARDFLKVDNADKVEKLKRHFIAEVNKFKLDGFDPVISTEMASFRIESGEYFRFVRKFLKSVRVLDKDEVNSLIANAVNPVFEGSQGVLLDEEYGFNPYTTWSKTTPANARELLKQAGVTRPNKTIGVIRSYMTRHGDGPFPTHDLTLLDKLKDEHNKFGQFMGEFRVGWFDLPLLNYARNTGLYDTIAVTHLDRAEAIKDGFYYCDRYVPTEDWKPMGNLEVPNTTDLLMKAIPHFVKTDPEEFLKVVANTMKIPVGITSFGASYKDKKFQSPIMP